MLALRFFAVISAFTAYVSFFTPDRKSPGVRYSPPNLNYEVDFSAMNSSDTVQDFIDSVTSYWDWLLKEVISLIESLSPTLIKFLSYW